MNKSASLALALGLIAPSAWALNITPVWTHNHSGTGASNSAEISAYDTANQNIWVVGPNGIDVLNATTGALVNQIALGGAAGSPNSVAIRNGIAAVAVNAQTASNPGQVIFYDTTTGNQVNSVVVGSVPDMVTFTPDGNSVLVAIEGEAGSVNPPVNPAGGIGIIDISLGVANATVNTVDFTAYDGQESTLRNNGVRIFPGISASLDLEPEYIAVSADGTTAYVTLQENNALAIVDLTNPSATPTLVSFGLKDHSLPGNGLDPTDTGGVISINNWPVFGMYMPDAIASYEAGGQTYLITANEGDSRGEEARVSTRTLDPTVFPNAATLQQNATMGRLDISTLDGDIDNDGDFDQLYAYGARSFSIWDAAGNLVWDSGDMIEQIMAAEGLFQDGRSDNKGPEPEGVAVLTLFGRTYAFIGLERTNTVLVYDVTNPNAPIYSNLIVNAGDTAPEGLLTYSANGLNYLVVTNEGSGTTTLYSVIPEPGTLALLGLGLAALRLRRKA